MVQIIQSEPTQRQSALEVALGQALQGFGSSFAQGQQTQRQQALADNQLKLKLYEMGVANPDQALAQLKGEYKQTEIAPAQPAQYGQELAGPVMPGQSPLKELLSAPVPAQMSPVNPLGTYSEAKMSEMAAKKQLEMLDQESKRADINYKTQQGNKLEEAAPLEKQKTFAEIRKLNAEAQKAGNDANPSAASKLSKMSAEAQSKVGAIASGIKAIKGVKNAMDMGYKPEHINPDTALIGRFQADTPFTKAQRTLDEVIGRLQSGGAIGVQEIATFRSMGPRPADSPEIQKEKIKDQMSFLNNKLTAFGLSEQDLPSLGFDTGGGIDLKSNNQGIDVNSVSSKAAAELAKRGL